MTAYRLALSNLVHDRGRTAVSVTGTAFAVVLIFMQLGFLGAVVNTATQFYDRLQFDLLLTSSEFLDLSRAGRIERTRLAQAHAAGGVADVLPLSVEQALWKNPTADPARGGKRWQLTLIGADPGRLDRTFRPDRSVFASAAEQAVLQTAMSRLDVVLLDRRSRPDFGNPRDMAPGTVTEVTGRRVELAGYFEIGTGFSYAGLLLTNEETYTAVTRRPKHQVSFGLVQLEPGQDVAAAAGRLRAVLPPDTRVWTREAIEEQESTFWVRKTAVGQFFYFGVVLALFVGAIFVYQMIVADIKKRLPEYATLRAMGYRFEYLMRVVIWQAGFLALAGYTCGLAASLGLYELTRIASKLPIGMTLDRLGVVLALTIGMCVGSGLVAVRKVRTADPADLF